MGEDDRADEGPMTALDDDGLAKGDGADPESDPVPPRGGWPRWVVTNILLHDGKVLLLKRSQLVGTFKGRWAGCSGHVEAHETVEQASYKEIREETGFKENNLRLLARGEPELIEEPHGSWLVHPFLYDVDSDDVTLDWEHVDFRWVRPEEVVTFDAVPGLNDVIQELLAARPTSSAD